MARGYNHSILDTGADTRTSKSLYLIPAALTYLLHLLTRITSLTIASPEVITTNVRN